jgi:hypothetical protein
MGVKTNRKLRGFLMAGAALAIPLGVVAVGLVQTPSGAATAVATKVKFTGSLKCTVTGSITFKPALFLSTGSTTTVKETTSLTASSSACKASGGLTQGGAKLASESYLSGVTFPKGTTCASLENAGDTASSATVSYKSTDPTAFTITPSTIAWSGYTESSNSAGYIDITLPNSGGTAKTTGSFPGKSSAALASSSTEDALLAACESTSGLSKITFNGKGGGASTLTVG